MPKPIFAYQRKFAGSDVTVESPQDGNTFLVTPYLTYPDQFYGSPYAHHMVRFGDVFTPLVGSYGGRFGRWEPDALAADGIVILEYFYPDAKKIIRQINSLAARFIGDPRSYDDIILCDEYYNLAQAGYALVRKHAPDFGITLSGGMPVALERGGLVAVRLALGLDRDAIVPNEIRVVTKRVHLKDEPDTHLAASVYFRNPAQIATHVSGRHLIVIDYVNPASGASVAAFILASAVENGRNGKPRMPSDITHLSISLTAQGTLFNRLALEAYGIKTRFVSLGDSLVLGPNYYLMDKPVGDAGHALRHHLPYWYRQ